MRPTGARLSRRTSARSSRLPKSVACTIDTPGGRRQPPPVRHALPPSGRHPSHAGIQLFPWRSRWAGMVAALTADQPITGLPACGDRRTSTDRHQEVGRDSGEGQVSKPGQLTISRPSWLDFVREPRRPQAKSHRFPDVVAGACLAHACIAIRSPRSGKRSGQSHGQRERRDPADTAVRRPHRAAMGTLMTTGPLTGSRPAPPQRPDQERACARCGSRFQPTPVRRLTCRGCYQANTDLDPMASRGALMLGINRSTPGVRDS
jgi:hypothetical protein